ncbi:hypothetical protein HanRHA438_Chr16g0776281 [Helianthus annuus]|nr:hypothetical protein HanRHA438_Chr16g0776281 [Helianthus annuus]
MVAYKSRVVDPTTAYLRMGECLCLCGGPKYRTAIHPLLKKVAVYFGAVLVNMRYWKKNWSTRKMHHIRA